MVLTCLLLATAGCMKAVTPEPAPVAEPPKVEAPVEMDPDIPEEYRKHFIISLAEGTLPDLFCLLAGRFASAGEEGKALHLLDRAADGFAETGNHAGEASVWSRKVLFLFDAGRDRDALSLAAEGSGKWKEPPLSAFPKYLAGRQALKKGDFAQAGELLRQALQENDSFPQNPYLLQLRRDTELAAGMAAVLSARLPWLLAAYGATGASGSGNGPASEGEGHLLRSLALSRELRRTKIAPFIPEAGFQRCEAEAYRFLGLEAGAGGRTGESLDRLARALELSRSAGDREGEIRSLLFLAELGLREGNAAEGLRAAREFRELADRYRSAPYQIWSRLLLARYHRNGGQTGEVIVFLREADRILSLWRTGPEAEMFQEICRIQRRALDEWLVELLAAEKRFPESLAAAEKAKARRLADLLAGEELGRNPAERERLRQAAGMEAQIRGLQRLVLKDPVGGRSGNILDRLQTAERGYRHLLERIGEEDEALLFLLAAREIDPAALQLLLDQDTTLFAYFVTDERTYVWAIHRSNIHMERIDLTRKELRALVFSFSDAVRERNRKNTEILSRRAYDLLLKPIIPFVSGERIGFIPDDALAHLPFAALNYRGRFLVEGFAVFHLPSAGLLRKTAGGTERVLPNILAFAGPEPEGGTRILQRAIQEMEAIRKRTGRVTVLLDRPASMQELGDMAAGYDILHFAVPVEFVPGAPLDSSLRLSPADVREGRLKVRDLFSLSLNTDAVVLSGCDPRKENDPDGLGLNVMQWAFLHSGSRSVMPILWPVQDRALARLLGLFYGRIERRVFPADSLRAAQLEMIREGHPPHVWAAFALAGY
jgi:CHAT domain-containing protein/tetratricopeptide (TPR) repeat protein